ncbi:DNA-binding protein [Paenibacillus sp. SYP-B3998]|uniref:DNA-binding protein n=1 Tax=Paenibacillus sp. SYP-B3998 TaxID=2678564 RepID=A0A6G3ZXF2_9BACL|nr:DNA-binding protein [Paenibacillus sp. SYP-B3998]NEW06785.1 DNA-binding protein [Paenibacillus sp. SYP-B3998]
MQEDVDADFLLEDPKNSTVLFEFAEALFADGKVKESIPLYKRLCDFEQVSLSDNSSIGHYRIFEASLGNGSEEDWKAVNQFAPFIKHLPDNYQLDALLKVARTCLTLQKWDEVGQYADDLRAHTVFVYSMLTGAGGTKEKLILKFPLVVYYGQSYLLKGAALRRLGKYEDAKLCVQGYADLSWFEMLDDYGLKEVEKFRVFAKGNLYTLNLYLGNGQFLDDFFNFIALLESRADLLAGLLTAVEAANMHRYNVDYILEKYSGEIEFYKTSTNQIWRSQYYHFVYQRAIYRCNNGMIKEGIDDALNCLSYATFTMHDLDFKKCSILYWNYRNHVSKEQEERFSTIIGGINDDEKIFVGPSCNNGIV